MLSRLFFGLVIVTVLVSGLLAESPVPPTRSEDIVEELFGQPVRDPYRWLEDVKSPEVRAWMDAQDKHARAFLHALPKRDEFVERLKSMLYIDAISAPHHRQGRYFYTRRHANKEKAIVYWRQGEDGPEKVLLDPNSMSDDGTVSLGTWEPTHDGKTVVYAIRRNNSDEAVLYVMDVATGKTSDVDVIEGAKYASPDWTPDGTGFYYTWIPPVAGEVTIDTRPGYAEVKFHKLGTDPKADPVIHPKTGDPQTFIGASLSRDGRWLFTYIQHGWNSNDLYFRDLQSKETAWKPFIVGKDAQYSVIPWKGNFYIATNEGAPKWRVFKTPSDKPQREAWQEIIAELPDATIDSVQIVGEHLALGLLRNATSQLQIHSLDGKLVRTVPLPDVGSASGLVGNPDEDEAYFSFTSFTVPSRIYRTSLKNGGADLWAEVKIPFDPAPYEAKQVWYPSKDGTKVSMFLIHKKGLKQDGTTPWYLYGYGGFNVSLTPAFSATYCVWLEQGGGIAIPNLRGGGEYGEEWHRAGMLHVKQNVFDDFIAAAEYLIREKYTSTPHLGIRGGSNGGLLVGAAVTQRPDLFKAVVCEVPLLDMVRYHKFGSGKTWVPEYGTADKEEDFKALFAYSPYHRVKEGTKYPAVLVTTSDTDDRVDPMHARKFAAYLQKATTSGEPVVLRIEKNAGHGGADLIKQRVDAGADSLAFLLSQLK